MSDHPPDAALESDPLGELIDEMGIMARRLEPAIEAVVAGIHDVGELVHMTGLPRRTVERLLDRAGRGTDVGSLRAAAQRLRPPTRRPGSGPAQVRRMHGLIDAAPVSRSQLDHVSATAATAVRRADWITEEFALDGRTLMLLGDHDLTALAVAPRLPETRIIVVDIDEHLLEFVDAVARQQELPVTCVYADFSLGLPEPLLGIAHVTFTDPPYTPDGVALFLARAIQVSHASEPVRIGMAYGFSNLHPTLGLEVQRQVLGLDLTIEALVPGFNAYHGAQAIGSRSDLYRCVPTARSRRAARRVASDSAHAIYTHGHRSVESASRRLSTDAVDALLAEVGMADVNDPATIGWVWTEAGVVPVDAPRQLFEVGGGRTATAVAASLLDGDESWLARMLISTSAAKLTMLVPNSHPDISNAHGQAALANLVRGKFELTYRRSQPHNNSAIVIAEAAPSGGGAPALEARRVLLSRPRLSLRHALAEALYKGSRAGHDGWPKTRTFEVAGELVELLGSDVGWLPVAALPRATIARAEHALDDALAG